MTGVSSLTLDLEGKRLELLQEAEDFASAFALLAQECLDALIVYGYLGWVQHRTHIVDFVAHQRLPTTYLRREFVEAGS